MGQKVNPIGLRLRHQPHLGQPLVRRGRRLRAAAARGHQGPRELKKRLHQAGVSRIIIERPHKQCRITIYAARPGVIIGKKGADIDKLRKDLAAMTDGEVHLNIVEIRKPETDAQLVAENIAQQLERRVAFRRAMKRSMQSAMRLGAKGVRIKVSGRLGGAEIARMEWYREGRVPLHTLRADIDYGFAEAKTTYGIIGVKVWVFKGEVLEHDPMALDKRLAGETARGEGACAAIASAARAATARQRTLRLTMLHPKKTKYRKQFKGRIHGDRQGRLRAELRLLRPEVRWSRSGSPRARSKRPAARSPAR